MGNVHWGVHGALASGANASVLMIGDSWFWYPLDNLARETANALPNQTFVVVGNNGAEAGQWGTKYRKAIDFGFKMYGSGVQALMLSGGGNDIAGMSDFLRILRDDCSGAKTVAGCFRDGQPDAIVARIMGEYREVILKFRAFNKTAPVVMHNYDYAWPTGVGLFGPANWLKAPMDVAKVPDDLRRAVFRELLNRLGEAQIGLNEEKPMGPTIAVASAGTMPEKADGKEQWWANELHPTPRGFKRLVTQAMLPSLKGILVA